MNSGRERSKNNQFAHHLQTDQNLINKYLRAKPQKKIFFVVKFISAQYFFPNLK
jgi:hypothetical protein